jgi:hypothetical protein
MKKPIKNKGGKRVGSGRKKANYQTKTIAFRVRVEWVEVIKSTVKAKVAELSQNSS